MAELIIPTPLRKFADNQSKLSVSGTSVIEAIEGLVVKYPSLKKQIFDQEGKLKRYIKVYVGDEDIEALQGESTALGEKDVISIIPAIAGGKA